MKKFNIIPIFLLIVCSFLMGQKTRPRDMGLEIGLFRTGEWNAITDVEGVTVGHETVIQGDSVRTGVTIIKPHGGDVFKDKVMGAVHVTNGYGKALGFTQVEELGTIETPIALTNTLNTFLVANAIVDYMISENPDIRSVNPVVGETNDSGLNDIRGRHVTKKHIFSAIQNAKSGLVAEGSVGAGTGTRALGFKGGIGTASPALDETTGANGTTGVKKTTIGATYVTGPYTIAISGDDQTTQTWDASVAMANGDTTITVAADETNMMSVGIGYTSGALTLAARQEFNNAAGDDSETEVSLSYTDGAMTFSAASDSGQKDHYGDEAQMLISAAYTDGDVTVAAKGTDQDEMEVSVTFAF